MSIPSVESRPNTGKDRILGPFAFLCIGATALIASGVAPEDLHAHGGSYRSKDYDQDGLVEAQEIVLGTMPGEADSDGDGYPDLEEIARKSDPLDRASIPGPGDYGLGMYAHVHNDLLMMGIAIYAKGGDFGGLDFEMGVLINGVKLEVTPITYSTYSVWHVNRSTKDPNDRVLVVNMPLSDSFVHRWGQFTVYSKIEDPSDPGTNPPSGDVTTMVASGSVISRVEDAPGQVVGGTGVIYRPLTPDASLPASWTGGQVCWQNTSAVGTDGTSVMYEITQASCESLDSSCNPSGCTAQVGTGIEIPDPGILIGGG